MNLPVISEMTSNAKPIQCSWTRNPSHHSTYLLHFTELRPASTAHFRDMSGYGLYSDWLQIPNWINQSRDLRVGQKREADGTQTHQRWEAKDTSVLFYDHINALPKLYQSCMVNPVALFLDKRQWRNLTSSSQVDRPLVSMWFLRWENLPQEYVAQIQSEDDVHPLRMTQRPVLLTGFFTKLLTWLCVFSY